MSFGPEKYFERAAVYASHLQAIFIWLTPFALASAAFLLTFSTFKRLSVRLIEGWNNLPDWIFKWAIPFVFTILSAWTAYSVIGGVPRIFDGFNYHFQARNFALGQLHAAAPPLPDLFRFPFIIIDGGRWYGSVYPGYSLLLAIGVRFGIDWMVNPVIGGLALLLMYFASREIYGERFARLVSVTGMLSPFFRMMSAIFMAHATAIIWVTLAMWMAFRWLKQGKKTTFMTLFWAGFALGWLYITRPQAGIVALLILFTYVLVKNRQSGWKQLFILALPLLFSIVFLAYYNDQLTGDYRINPRYFVDPERKLGFGDDLGEPLPGGRRSGHDLGRGLHNAALLLNLWNAEMLGWGSWGILGWMTIITICPIVLERKNPLHWILLSSILLNVGLYVFYYTASPNFGPRYLAEVIPASLILFASGLTAVSSREPGWCRYNGKPVGLFIVTIILCLISGFVTVPLHRLHYGILPPMMARRAVPDPGKPSIILIPPQLYRMNIYTWNSPDLSGNIFLPLGKLSDEVEDIQRIKEAFPNRSLYRLERTGTDTETLSLLGVDSLPGHSQ